MDAPGAAFALGYQLGTNPQGWMGLAFGARGSDDVHAERGRPV